ncbi:receptor-like serine/threonine-protein kinase SD1-8 [Typha angustifolia]|uniref:receptor-like serine/threonine-protein kinase SD1-8 n=1 Tax=Typha angustifolia TaxID=59011 RepID=UPI003C2FF0AD
MRALIAAPFLLYFIIPALCSLATGADTLIPNRPLTDAETLISADDSFALGFFSPINSTNRYVGIWYHKVVTGQTVVWVANRQNPIADTTGSLSITAGGDLVIYDKNSTIIWSSNSSVLGLTGAVAQILDNGNFVVREAASYNTDAANVAWQSFDHPTDTFLPGMKIGENLTSGLKIKYQSWTSVSDPAPGNCILGLDLHGDPQLFLSSLMGHIWRGGPWNGIRFSGTPEMNSNNILAGFGFTNTNNSVFNIFEEGKSSAIGRLTVLQSVFKFFVWSEESKTWVTYVYSPRDSCDNISTCGPFALCDLNIDTVTCSCMQGFQPKSLNDWALRDFSGGCVRKTKLDCTNGTDGFALVSSVKLPDTSSSTVDVSLSLEECKALCLKNCSCTGYATANISGSGSGCILWTSNLTDLRKYTSNGQDLYLRLAAADLGSSSHNSHKKIIAGILVGSTAGALLLAMVVYCAWTKKGKNHKKKQDTISFLRESIDSREGVENFDLPLFDFSIIEAATNDFSVDNKLGEGGFGPVYKGQLREGEYIAVKRLSKTSAQGSNEFKNEVVLIAKLQHRNLVRLLGCCIQREERMLVYEYMPNKSLDVLLFDKSKGPPLDWRIRYNIIFGIARGLLYLHQDSSIRIIHRDLKASNILLDKDMNPKISDFGLARIFAEEETMVNTNRIVGTYGYMSPEYAMGGIFSVKSDVFSFGVLILEIISGKRNKVVINSSSKFQENLLWHAWSLWKEGNDVQLLDESMNSSFSLDEALCCIKVGLLCVQQHPEDRPTMSSVVVMLGGENSSLPDPRQPGFVAMRSPSVSNSLSSKQDVVSITILEAR